MNNDCKLKIIVSIVKLSYCHNLGIIKAINIINLLIYNVNREKCHF